ncbi:MAG: hypothetical protein SYC29_09050 [Planctomycetota bacterium]|nr:hypothetical protein [Planctomycetota bacterium]
MQRALLAVFHRLHEQLIGHIVGVVLARDGDAVADPLAHRVLRERHRPLLLARAPQRLEGILPRLDAGLLHNRRQTPVELSAPAQRDDPFLSFLGRIEGVLHDDGQLGHHRDDALLVAGVMLRLGASYGQPVVLPIDVRPCQQMRLGWHAQAGEPGQPEEQLPLEARARLQNLVRFRRRDVADVLRCRGAGPQVTEGRLPQQPTSHRRVEDALRVPAVLPDRRLADALLGQPVLPVGGIIGRDGPDEDVRVEVGEQLRLRLLQLLQALGLQAAPRADELLQEITQPRARPRRRQSDLGQPIHHRIVQAGQPERCLVIQRVSPDDG